MIDQGGLLRVRRWFAAVAYHRARKASQGAKGLRVHLSGPFGCSMEAMVSLSLVSLTDATTASSKLPAWLIRTYRVAGTDCRQSDAEPKPSAETASRTGTPRRQAALTSPSTNSHSLPWKSWSRAGT